MAKAKGTTEGITVKVDGAKQLRRTMKKAGADMADFADANSAAAGIVVRESQSWVPRASGALAGSIRGSKAKTSATVRAGGARIPYAGVQEYGWPARHIRPHPYLTTAAKATESQWVDLYMTRLDAIVSKISGAPS